MIKLHWDPHPGTTKKKPPSSSSSPSARASSSTTSAVAKLLLRCRGRGGSAAAAKDESIEFFSALRNSPPDPRGAASSDHPGQGGAPDVRGKTKRAGDGEKLLSTGTGKNDYNWLLTPPASPLWSPATSAAAENRAAAPAPAPSWLERASSASASYGKGNSRIPLARRENASPASRLARSSSSTSQFNAHRPSYGRMLSSSASASSINTLSNASASSTPRGSSAATSPRTPATARSAPAAAAAAAARSRHRDRTQALHVFGSVAAAGGQPINASSSRPRPSPTAPTSGTRPRATPGATATTSSPRSTAATSQQPVVTTRRGANSVARSGSTPQPASLSPRLRDAVNLAAGVSRVAQPASTIKPRQAPAPEKERQGNGNGGAAASTAAQRWRPAPPTLAAATVAAGRNARRENPVAVAHGSPRATDSRRKIDAAANTSAAAATRRTGTDCNSLTSTTGGGRNKWTATTDTDAKAKRLWQGAAARRHLIAAAARRNATTPTGRRSSVASRSRLGIESVVPSSSGAGSTTTPAKGKPPVAMAAAAASPRVVAVAPDAFPSTRYDAMLLREDPRNLTWLHGCDDDGDYRIGGGGGGGLVDASLEPFDVPAGSSSSSTGLHRGATLNFGANLDGSHVI